MLFPPAFRSSPFPAPFVEPFHTANAAPPVQPAMQEEMLPRALNYNADYSGCGFWRMLWPEHVLNAHHKLTVHGSTTMTGDGRYFAGIKSVRIQRQATQNQLAFVKFLKQLSEKLGFRIIYEIDDIMFHEDIPEYNKYRPAFANPDIRAASQEIMKMCDEITVTCDFMRQYYQSKTGNNNITVIPNYPPKFWIGQFYDPERVTASYRKNRVGFKNSKPRILYPGSGAHFDVENRCNQNDDFAHVRDVIRKTVDKYQWVFLSAFPLPLRDLVTSGKIEYHPWKRLYEYPEKLYDLDCNIMIAPLQDNTFNRAKSDLKYIEAGCYGVPIVCQDISTYKNAPIRFTTGDEMIDQIDKLVSSAGYYQSQCLAGRKVAESRFLELDENIDKYLELYTLPYKDSGRKLLNSIN